MVFSMPVADANLAKNALALPPNERAELASLLIDSLKGTVRSDEEIKRMLRDRAEALRSGKDKGLSFEEVFGEAP
jgi:putative addiction module component (TIGR02574 family)